MDSRRRVAFSLHHVHQNVHCLCWGPNGYLAVAAENFVHIYQLVSGHLTLVRTLSKHKFNVTVVRFSHPSVELSDADAFSLFLAVGDESGNLIVYDVASGERHSGFSPDRPGAVRIVDARWSRARRGALIVLTSAPALMYLEAGNVVRRRSSSVTSWADVGLPFQGFNMACKHYVSLSQRFDFIALDPYNTANLVLVAETGSYVAMKAPADAQPTASQTLRVPNIEEPVLGAEFFPHAQNRLVITGEKGVWLYDLVSRSTAVIINAPGSMCACEGLFAAAEDSSLWMPTCDGSLARISLGKRKWKKICGFSTMGLNPVTHFVADSYDSNRAALLSRNGTLCVVEQRRCKLFIVAMLPSFHELIASWTTDNERIAFVTNYGFVGILMPDGSYARYHVEGKGFESICFAGENRLFVGSSKLDYIDLRNRRIVCKSRQITPKNLISTGTIIAYNPLPNILEIAYLESPKKTIVFKEKILAFASRIADPSKWAVVVSRMGICVIDCSQIKASQVRFPVEDENVTSIVYYGSTIVTAGQVGDLRVLNVESGRSISKRLASCSIQSIAFCNGSLIAVTTEYDCFVLDASDLHVIREIKWRLMKAHVMNSDFIVIQTSRMALRLLSLPNFECLTTPALPPSTARARFTAAKTVDDFERIAMEVGDLDFVQFIRSVQRKDKLPLPELYNLTRDGFIAKEKLTRLIEQNTKRDEFIEFLILTGDRTGAADRLMQSRDTKDMLTAYACLAPNADAARAMAEADDGSNTSLISRLLVMCGEFQIAIGLLIAQGERAAAFKYTKILLGDTEYSKFIADWIKEKPGIARNTTIREALNDPHGTLALLQQFGYISKAYAYLAYLRASSETIPESPFPDDIPELATVLERIESIWNDNVCKFAV